MKTHATWICITVFSCLVMSFQSVQAQTPGTLTYGPAPTYTRYFGPWVMHKPGWDRYLMYFSANSAVVNGVPGNTTPGDSGTYNSTCSTWWADRIWLTWHMGDGMTPGGWVQPIKMLDIGGAGETALIGDPSVVYWQGQWHMYYEGTNDCNGNGNLIFHATATNWVGPWTKQGMLWRLGGNTGGSGLSWPTVLVDNGQLYLYYTDGNIRLLVAEALDNTGHNFYTTTIPVSPDLINRGEVEKVNGQYRLVYDIFGVKEIRVATSSNRSSFPSGNTIAIASSNDQVVGLPTQEDGRVYFTWEEKEANNPPWSDKGIRVLTLP